MLGDTHRRIAKSIAGKLSLGKRESSLLESGSTNPDSWADFPHHRGKDEEIVRNIIEARKLYLENDDECYYTLGIAFHFIQDRWTMRPRMSDKHTAWERAIDLAEILDDSQLKDAIRNIPFPEKAEEAYLTFLEETEAGVTGVADDLWTLYLAHKWTSTDKVSLKALSAKVIRWALLDRPTTWSNPLLDLNFAFRICSETASYVLEDAEEKLHRKSESKQEEKDMQELEVVKKRHRRIERKLKLLQKRIVEVKERLNHFPFSYSEPSWKVHELRNDDTVKKDALEKYMSWEHGRDFYQRKVVSKGIEHFCTVPIYKESLRVDVIEENQKTAYRVVLYEEKSRAYKYPGRPTKIEVYLDCASKNLALYLLEFLKLFLEKPPQSWESDREIRDTAGFMEWPNFLNLPIPDENDITTLLSKYSKDKRTLLERESRAEKMNQLFEANANAIQAKLAVTRVNWYDPRELGNLLRKFRYNHKLRYNYT